MESEIIDDIRDSVSSPREQFGQIDQVSSDHRLLLFPFILKEISGDFGDIPSIFSSKNQRKVQNSEVGFNYDGPCM